jgi:hypothetical protein
MEEVSEVHIESLFAADIKGSGTTEQVLRGNPVRT